MYITRTSYNIPLWRKTRSCRNLLQHCYI